MSLVPSAFWYSVHQPTHAFNKIGQSTYHTVQFVAPGAETCRSYIMNWILRFVFYFNLLSALVGWCTENRVCLFLLDRQAPARRCSQFLLYCDLLFACVFPVIEWQTIRHAMYGATPPQWWAGAYRPSRAEYTSIYKHTYTHTHTHTTSEKCAVVVRFKPEITLQPLSEFCIYLHNPKTR